MLTPLDYTLIFACLLSNAAAFVLMGVDKYRSARGKWRIPERRLLLWCVCLGALGGWLGMRVFRHKTRHAKFYVTIPILLVLQCAFIGVYVRYWR